MMFWIQKLKSYNSVYRCYAKNMSNYKNIAKPSKKIGVNFWPLPEHKMTQTALWPTYLKLLPQCSKTQSIGKRSQSQIRIPDLKCQTIRKVKFLSKKFNFDKTLKFFLGNQSCQQLKSPKPQHFHEIFTQNIFDNFSREIKVVNS
mgnify:CR=1 FL=1